MDINLFAKHADLAARIIQQVMINDLGLMPPASYTLTTHNGNVWLVAAMDTLALGGKLQAYEDANVAHQLSTALSSALGSPRAIPVIIANHTGMRYCVLFGNKPTLPKRVDFPGFGERDVMRFGMGMRGEIKMHARLMKNVVIGAAQEMGKSNILRLVAHQARTFGWKLYLADSQAHTFNPDAWDRFTAHPVAVSTEQLLAMLECVRKELIERAVLFRAAAASNGGLQPADLDAYNAVAAPLPRMLLALDEATTPLNDKEVFAAMASLLREGRKWGLHIVLAGHEWHKDVIPAAVNDMLQTRIALPMIDENSGAVVTRSRTWGKWVIGKKAGRGVMRTNTYTPMQFYFITPEMEAAWMAPAAAVLEVSPLSEQEALLVKRAMAEAEGKMTVGLLESWGMGHREARQLVETFEARGWLAKDAARGNARVVTPKLVDLLPNRQTCQTLPIPQIWRQTAENPVQTLNMAQGAMA